MLFRPGTSASSRSSATIDVSGKVFLRESLLEGPGDVSIVDVVCAESEEHHTSNRDSIPAPEHQSEMPYESHIATRPSTERKKSKRQKVVGVLEKLKDKMGRKRHTTPPLKAANSGYCPGYVHRAVEELPEDDIEEDRCQWKVIQDIPTHAYKDLLLSLPFAQNMLDAYIYNSARGAYHYAVFIKTVNSKGKIEEFVVKLPGHGTPDRWTPEDEYMLDREAETMQLVHSRTNIPVPEVMAWSSTLKNTVGFPYIVMRCLPGESASQIWYDKPYDPTTAHEVADTPSLETEKKRLNFLRSLAKIMTELDKVQFDGIGVPCSPDRTEAHKNPGIAELRYPVGKLHVWPYADDIHAVETRQPSKTTQNYISNARSEFTLPEPGADGEFTREQLERRGIYNLLDMVFSHPVFRSEPDDLFVLRHDDLDLQNILTDAAGNITGIIDWDGSLAVPRCVGHAAVPNFLRSDWLPHSIVKRPHMIFSFDHYREVYAAAMVEAGNPDAIFTTKSAIYQAAFAAIYEGGSIYSFSEKILNAIPGIRQAPDEMAALLGQPQGSKFWVSLLKWELFKILKPEFPRLTWNEVEADLAAREWMADFEGFLELGMESE